MTPDDQRTHQLERQLRARAVTTPHMFGYHWTFHALARMKVRDIEPDWVADALNCPSRSCKKGTVKHVKHIGLMASVIVNLESKTVITVGYGILNDPNHPIERVTIT